MGAGIPVLFTATFCIVPSHGIETEILFPCKKYTNAKYLNIPEKTEPYCIQPYSQIILYTLCFWIAVVLHSADFTAFTLIAHLTYYLYICTRK
jgi:hypothetical protein